MYTGNNHRDVQSSTLSQPYETRTSLTGRPLQYQHDHHTNMMLSEAGAFGSAANAGANLLPPGYTDNSLVHIPIKLADLQEQDQGTTERSQGLLRRLTSHKEARKEIKVVPMSRGDYLKYWAKGEDGEFLPSVVTPPEGRAEWVRKQSERHLS